MRLRLGVAAAVVVLCVGADLARPPQRQLTARAMVLAVHSYQSCGHALVPRGQCRFRPTCSNYAEAVIREHGALRGGWLAARRLLRCGPWTEPGTVDPPPTRVSSSG